MHVCLVILPFCSRRWDGLIDEGVLVSKTGLAGWYVCARAVRPVTGGRLTSPQIPDAIGSRCE